MFNRKEQESRYVDKIEKLYKAVDKTETPEKAERLLQLLERALEEHALFRKGRDNFNLH
ncbi:MAG: hypothetical protein P4N59_12000 [Negativicutes bacterium]|nr:hypothetical protein [Negativicutes bacterium]